MARLVTIARTHANPNMGVRGVSTQGTTQAVMSPCGCTDGSINYGGQAKRTQNQLLKHPPK